jgi:hypothetical protein
MSEFKSALWDALEQFDETCDRTRFEALVGRAYSKAMSGDGQMLRYLLNQCAGRPIAQILANYVVERVESVAVRRERLLAVLAEIRQKQPFQLLTDEHNVETSSAPGAGAALAPAPGNGEHA